ncbi:anti-CBASS protein Acb1 family protein, partial [Pasteurella multocida]
IKSSTNTLLIDKENEYEQKELTFAGLRDLLIEFRNAVAGAAEMPVTILFGQSVSGLASGDEDIQNYHESIHGLQESRLRPVFEKLDPIISTMAVGFYPQDWWFEFVSLNEVKQEQKVNMLNTFSAATNILMQNGVLSEIQVANELKESGLFASISAEDIAQLETPTHDDEFTRSDEGAKETKDSEV